MLLLVVFTLLLRVLSHRPTWALSTRLRCSRATSAMSALSVDVFEKPVTDDNHYQYLVLANGIRVLLVRDLYAEKSACALSIADAGAAKDSLPGLAHMTEHAVFLGSEKYPVENAYKAFLSKHGGSSNGGTAMEYTMFKFAVDQQQFAGALDIFSQFFLSPLFQEEVMSREINAVDAEDAKNRMLDFRRRLQVLKFLFTPSHPYAKFSTGNINTLAFGCVDKYGQALADAIRRFHSEYYLPHRMNVAIVGPQPLPELAKMAEMFAGIRSRSAAIHADSQQQPEQEAAAQLVGSKAKSGEHVLAIGRGSILRIKPINDLRDMTVIWQLPYLKDDYRYDPSLLLSFVLSHKGEGSMFALLQDLGYITGLSASTGASYRDFTLFEVSFALTNEGLDHYEEILYILSQYLAMMKRQSQGDYESLWRDLYELCRLNFFYREKQSAYEYAASLVGQMLDYSTEHTLSGGWLIEEKVHWTKFQECLEQLQMEDGLVLLRSRSFDLPADDKGYLAQKMQQFDDHWRERQEEAKAEELRRNREYFTQLWKYLHDERDTSMARQHAEGEQTGKEEWTLIEPYYGVSFHLSKNDTLSQLLQDPASALPQISSLAPKIARFQMPQSPNPFICHGILHSLASSPSKATTQEAAVAVEQTGSVGEQWRRSAPPVMVKAAEVVEAGVDSAGDDEGSYAERWKARNCLWFSADQLFHVPKSYLTMRIECGACDDGHPVLGLISSVFQQATARRYNLAQIAGLDYDLSLGRRGIELSFGGYTEKLPVFVAKVVADMFNVSFWREMDPGLFENSRERRLRALQSWSKERPDSQASDLLTYLLQEGAWLPHDKVRACENTTYSLFLDRIEEIFRSFSAHVAHFHGVNDADLAIQTYDHVLAAVPQLARSPPQRQLYTRARVLREGSQQVIALPAFNREEENSAYVLHLQMDKLSERTVALLLVMRRLLSEPAFHTLRTQQQLGYIVSLSTSAYGKGRSSYRGLQLRILSKRFDPLTMHDRVQQFLIAQQQHWREALTPTSLSDTVQSVVQTLRDPPTHSAEEASDFWHYLLTDLPFSWTKDVVAALETLTVDDVLEALDHFVFDRERRKAAIVMIFSPEHQHVYERLRSGEQTVDQSQVCLSLEEVTALRDRLPQ